MGEVFNSHPVIKQALRLDPSEGSYTVLIPAQSTLVQDILKDPSGSPASKAFPGCCVNCRFWSAPPEGVPAGYCNRLVLSDMVVVTPIENASLSLRHDFLFTPATFACNYFSPKLKKEEV